MPGVGSGAMIKDLYPCWLVRRRFLAFKSLDSLGLARATPSVDALIHGQAAEQLRYRHHGFEAC